MADRVKITCPCCDTKLVADSETGEILSETRPKKDVDKSFSEAMTQVRSGESLWAIARKYSTSVSSISRLNGLGSKGTIFPGQKLKVPANTGSGLTARLEGFHTVRRGETAWDIARARGVALKDLIAWNGLGPDAMLRPGDRLRLAPASR